MLTPKQQGLFRPLVDHAWIKHCRRTPGLTATDKIAKDKWRRRVMMDGLGIYSTKDAKAAEQFATLMSLFERIVGNRAYWTLRAEKDEDIRRIRFWIDQALARIGGDWRYAQGIIDQMNFPGLDIDDLTLGQLHKVFQALDTHLRREQRRAADQPPYPDITDWKDQVREQFQNVPRAPHRRAA